VCGQDDARTCLVKGSLRLVRCNCCAMVYATPVPPEFVSGQYYDRAAAEYYLSPDKLAGDYADVRFERELRLFRRHCPRGAVIDVGCSSGAFLFQLNRRFPGNYLLQGTDVSGPAMDYAESRGVAVTRGDFVSQAFAEKSFDAVTFWAVLEHLPAPKEYLEKASSILNPGGRCFVLVPNMNSLASRLLGARYRYIYPQHLNYFTRATLIRLAETRFEVVELGSSHFNPIVIWQDWRRDAAEVTNTERAALLRRTTSYKKNPLLAPARIFYRLTEKTLGAFTLADNLVAVLRRK
jgi:2-polyprenyl-3-methyl-5-hydroxy-6-metoxy-1,4-benzoquinol methylase